MRSHVRILFRTLYVARFRTLAFSHFAFYNCPDHSVLLSSCVIIWSIRFTRSNLHMFVASIRAGVKLRRKSEGLTYENTDTPEKSIPPAYNGKHALISFSSFEHWCLKSDLNAKLYNYEIYYFQQPVTQRDKTQLKCSRSHYYIPYHALHQRSIFTS